MAAVLIKNKEREIRDRYRKGRPCVDGGRDWNYTSLGVPEAKIEMWSNSFIKSLETADTLISCSGLQSYNCERITF